MLNIRRQKALKVPSIWQIFIFHKTFALKNDSHHDKVEILSFLAKLFMHWYLARDALHRTFTLQQFHKIAVAQSLKSEHHFLARIVFQYKETFFTGLEY